MAGAYILWNDVLKSAATSLVTSGLTANVADGLPQSNLLDRRIAKVCRVVYSGASSSTTFTHRLDRGGDATVRAVCVVGASNRLNPAFELLLTFRAKLYNSASTLVHDSGVKSVTLQAFSVPRVWLYVLPAAVAASRLDLETGFVSVPGGSGYVDIGRVFASDCIELPIGVDQDWSITAVDSARALRSRGQQLYSETTPRFRQASVRISQIPESLAINSLGSPQTASFQLLGLQAGISDEVIVSARTTDDQVKARLTIFGRLMKPPVITHQGGGYYATQLDVEEAL